MAFIRVIWHPEYIRMGWLPVFVKRWFLFPKPTAYFNMSLPTDYSLIFEHKQQPVNSDIFLDLPYDCKTE
jgi:hypothetical protein